MTRRTIKGIVIKILPYHAQQLRSLWSEMKELGITEDFGKNLHDAIYTELMNLQLRWGDAIDNAVEKEYSEEAKGETA